MGGWVAVAETCAARGKASKSKKVAGAALLAAIAAGAHAQTAVVDGHGAGGCMVGVMGCGLPTSNAIYTDFYTQGGAGSGGGAGLGGVFFVNAGASLSLNNVTFEHNTVQGGDGGSTPDVTVGGASVPLSDKTSSVASVTAFQVTPTIVNVNGSLMVSGVTLSGSNPLLKAGGQVAVAGTDGSTGIGAISGNNVTFTNAVAVDPSAVKTVTGAQVTANGNSVTSTAFATLAPSAIGTGMTVIGAGIPDGTTVTAVQRDANNNITSVTLSNNVTQPVTNGSLQFVDVTSFDASQYTKTPDLTANQIRLSATGLGLAVGMTLSGDGVPAGTKVVAINGDVVTLSNQISGLSFTGSLPAATVGSNTIQMPAADNRFTVGTPVSGAGIPPGTTVIAVDPQTGALTLSANLTDIPKSLSTQSILSQAGSTLVLRSTSGLQAGMTLQGAGIPDGTTIRSVNTATNTVVLSTAPTAPVSAFVASSPLSTGGSLNNIGATGAHGSNGANGLDGDPVVVWITDGEGRKGSNGGNGGNGINAAGGKGGNGGDGSAGAPFNYDLTMATIQATKDAIADTAEAAGALATFPPNAALSAAHIAAAAVSYADLAVGIVNLADWGADLALGLAGRGGDGSVGGKGGNGSDFYGGGAGGNGGDGGRGALNITDGGTGGDGGSGGMGGFGAGGGSGGAAGSGGNTGNAADGSDGAGGLGGFGGGVGSDGSGLHGGGGSGLGGAIFVRDGGTLTITGDALFADNTVLAGSSNNGGAAGQAAGSDIFMMKGSNVLLAPGVGHTIRIEGSIADDSTASIGTGTYAPGAGADLHVGGGGLVQLLGANTYSGKTYLEGGTLQADIGQGLNVASSVVFHGTGNLDNLSTSTAGTLLLDADVIQRAGTLPGQFSWNGAGGFAAGTTDGLTIDFGKTPGSDQTLQWGSSYIGTDSTMVFGSEYALGSVTLKNGIDLNHQVGNIAVYDSKQVVGGQEVQDSATLSGNLVNGGLRVGAAGYAGSLFLTGQNALTSLEVDNGKVSTLGTDGTGHLMASAGGAITVKGGSLTMGDAERGTTVTVDAGGNLVSAGGLTANALDNAGVVSLLSLKETSSFGSVTNRSGALLNVMGTTSVTGTLANQDGGTVLQTADMAAGSVVQDGFWGVGGARTLGTSSLTGQGTFAMAQATDQLTLDLSGDSTFAGALAGDGSFVKDGSGTLTLTGASSNTGGIEVKAGTLDTTGGGTLADTGAVTIDAGATFRAGTADTVGAVSNAGTLELDAAQTVASLASQAGGVTKVNADLTSTGAIAIADGGTIEQSASITAASVDNSGTLNVHDARTIATGAFSGGATGLVNLAAAGDQLTLDQSGDSTYAGQVSGQGALVKTGNGTLNLTGSNGFTGGLTVAGGVVDTTGGGTLADDGAITVNAGAGFIAGTADTVGAVTNHGALQINAAQTVASLANTGTTQIAADLSSQSTITNAEGATVNQGANVNATSTVTNDGTWTVFGAQTLASGGFQGTGTTALQDAVLTVQQSADSIYTGSFTGNGGLVKTGGGTLTLTGASTHTGGTLVSEGTLDTTGGGTLADAGAVGVAAGATFRAGTADTIGAVTNAGTLEVNAAQTVASLANLATGVAKVDADVAASGTVSNAGTVEQSADITAGAVDNSGTLDVHGQRTLATGTLTGAASGNIVLAATGDQLTVDHAGDAVYGGQVSGQGAFVKAGAGMLVMSGASTGTGRLAVNAGTLEVTGSVASTDVRVAQGASLGIAGHALAGQASVTNAGTLNVRADNTVASFSNSGTVNGPGKLTASTYQLNDGSVVNGNLGAGTLTTQGNVLLNGTSDASVVDVTADSTLTLGGAQRLSQQAAVTVDGRLVLANGDQTVATLAGGGSVAMNAYHLNVTGGGTFTGTLTSTSGSSLALDGAAVSLTDGSGVSTESLNLSNGSSIAVAGGSQLSTGTANVAAGSTLSLAAGANFGYQTLTGSGNVDAAQFTNAAVSTVSGSLTFLGDYRNVGTLSPGVVTTAGAQQAVASQATGPVARASLAATPDQRAAAAVSAYTPGTVTVMGNYTEAGSLNLGVTPTQYAQVRVGGTATAAAGSTLTMTTWNGAAPVRGTAYQAISDLNGDAKRVNGAFGDVQFSADGAAPARSAAMVLDVATGRAIATGLNQAGSTFADLGQTTGQRQVASALFNAATAAVGVNQVDTTQVAGRAAAALLTTPNGVQKATPDYYAGMADYGFSAANAMSRQLMQRSAAQFGQASPVGGSSLFADLHTDNVSPLAGEHLRRDELTLGGEWQATSVFAFGGLLSTGSGTLGADFGSGKASGGSFRVYGKARVNDKLMLLAGIGHGSYSYDLTRDALSAQATGHTRGSGTDFNLGMAYDAYRRGGFSVAPYLGLDRGRFHVGGFSEQGMSDQRLVLGDFDTNRTTATLGSTFTWQKDWGGRAVQLSVDAALQSVLQEGNRTVDARLGADPSVQFPLTFDSRKRTLPIVGVGANVDLGKGFTASASVDAALSSRRDDSFRLQVSKQF